MKNSNRCWFDWEEGTLDAAGVERVRVILKSSEAAQRYYLQRQMIDAALQLGETDSVAFAGVGDTGGSWKQPATASGPNMLAAKSGGNVMKGWLAAVALLFCLLVARLAYLEVLSPARTEGVAQHSVSSEATSHGVALVTRLVDIEWSENQAVLDVGEAIVPGRFAIDSGFAQIEFFCGATVIIEGPAELELKSPTLARMVSGRLRAQVPPAARGFSLEVEDMKVVDLGTEFGLSMSSGGADVQVFDGVVELHQPDQEIVKLTAGDAVARNEDGQIRGIEMRPEHFLDIATLDSHDQGQKVERYERWKRWSLEVRSDPRLMAYYAFDQVGGWRRRLGSSVEPTNSELDGAIVGARHVPGRWPTKGSLEFRKPGDRVRVHIPGEFGSLTFACWVRIDSLDRWFNSLFLTDNYNEGEPHWQILDSGQMYFSVRPVERETGGPKDFKVLSPPFWNPSLSGKWLHLAATFDLESGRVAHYLNGELLHEEVIPRAQLPAMTRIGTASIGNWSIPTRSDAPFAVRNLNGSIDEFAIFSDALSADEIQDMHKNGRP